MSKNGTDKSAKNSESNATQPSEKIKNLVVKSKDTIISAIDENGNGKIDIEDIIIKGLKTPGIRINRADFLRKELFKNFPDETVEAAVNFNPAYAKISLEEIDKIADEVIKFERNCVSGISTALGVPGGVAMVATIPADIAQYYGYMLRTVLSNPNHVSTEEEIIFTEQIETE